MVTDMRLVGWVFISLAVPLGHAQGEVYKCPDATGRPTYTNVKRDTVGKNCTLVSKEVSVVPAQAPTRATPSSASSSTSATRNENRRKILESELQNEHQLLADARQRLAEEEGIRTGDERNYAKVQERLRPYHQTVDQHTKNIEQLRGELGRIR
jgi:pyruvate/2-oxoglutarate dehydrogenase complex dihydrolipoamide acyltransferase (E2) component